MISIISVVLMVIIVIMEFGLKYRKFEQKTAENNYEKLTEEERTKTTKDKYIAGIVRAGHYDVIIPVNVDDTWNYQEIFKKRYTKNCKI